MAVWIIYCITCSSGIRAAHKKKSWGKKKKKKKKRKGAGDGPFQVYRTSKYLSLGTR